MLALLTAAFLYAQAPATGAPTPVEGTPAPAEGTPTPAAPGAPGGDGRGPDADAAAGAPTADRPPSVQAMGRGLGAMPAAGQNMDSEGGVVVRVHADVEPTATYTLVFTNAEGKESVVELSDLGVPPDAKKGDGIWVGVGTAGGDTVTVAVADGDRRVPAGTAEWEAKRPFRELEVKLTGGTATATAAYGTPAPGAPSGGGPGMVAPAAGGGGGFAVGSPPSDPNAGRLQAGVFYAALLVAGLSAVVLVGTLVVGRRRARLSASLVPIPAQGLLGPGSPGPDEPLGAWLVDPSLAEALVAELAQRLSTHHRVVVVAAPELELPALAGGPAWRIDAARPPRAAQRAVAALAEQAGPPVRVLLAPGVDLAAWGPVFASLRGAAVATDGGAVGNLPVAARVGRDAAGWTIAR